MNRIRTVWARGQVAVGSFLTVPSPRFAEVFGNVGYDWIIVDQQHGAISQDGLLSLVLALEASGSAILVRVGESDLVGVSRALDLGAHGVVAPMISTRDAAEVLAAATRYPPLGERCARAHPSVQRTGAGQRRHSVHRDDRDAGSGRQCGRHCRRRQRSDTLLGSDRSCAALRCQPQQT